MFAPSRYLAWASQYYGKVRFDLATSGMPPVPLGELGALSVDLLGDADGWSNLRNAIAAYNGVPREEAIATLGTTHAVWLAYSSLIDPGDEILVEEPAYEPLVRIAEGVGARVVRFFRPRDERFALDPGRVARALTARTKVVVVTNLHNPSGIRAGDDALQSVARVAATRGAMLLVDEVYAAFDDLVDDRGIFRGSARRLAPNVVCASSLTKCYGLGPQRVGWLTGPAEVIARAQDAMVASAGALPLCHAQVGVRAFEKIRALADRTRGLLAGKRDRVEAWTQAMGLRWSAPRAGLFGFVEVPGVGDLMGGIEAAARDREVLVAPGAFFGVPDGFRVAWTAPVDVLDEGLARLGEAVTAWPRR